MRLHNQSAKKSVRAQALSKTTRWVFATVLFLNLSIFSLGSATGTESLSSNTRANQSNGSFTLAQKDVSKQTPQSKSKKKSKPKPKSGRAKSVITPATAATSPSSIQRYLTLGIFSNIIILGIYAFWVRVREENTVPPVYAEAPRDARPGFDMKPVKLQRNQGIDPLTVRADGTSMIQPIGKFKVSVEFGAGRGDRKSDPDYDDISDDDTVAFGGDDLEPVSKRQFPATAAIEESSGPIPPSNAFKIKSLKTTSEMIKQSPVMGARPASALFPPEIALHYQAKPGEKLALTCDFTSPLYSTGTLIITNKRLMAVYQRHVFKLFLPQVSVENRRNCVKLRQIDDVSLTGSNRPLLLGVGAFAAWIPSVGILIAGVCVLAFFFWTRPELAIRMDNQILRTYPLRPSDMGRALHLIDRARKQLASRHSKLPLKPIANDLRGQPPKAS